MKILSFLSIAIIVLLLMASCSSVKGIQDSPEPAKDTIKRVVKRQDVDGLKGQIVLRPIDNPVAGAGKTYNSFYDFSNKTLNYTDNINDYTTLKNFLPEYIGVDSSIRGARFESKLSKPFVTFTKKLKDDVTKQTGIGFNSINNYQTANASNVRLDRDSLYALNAFLNMLLQKNVPAPVSILGDSLVEGGQAMFIMHPIGDTIKGIREKNWYDLYDYAHKCVYTTDDTATYRKINKALPMEIKKGETENAALVQGIEINPYVLLDSIALNTTTREKGLELNGVTSGQDLNKWRVLKITAVTIVLDYKNVIANLRKRIGNYTTQPSPPQSKTTQNASVTTQNVPVQKKTSNTTTYQKTQKSKDPNRPFDPNE